MSGLVRRYALTGVDREGRRFSKHSDNFHYLASHNVWRGNLWEVDLSTGRRTRIKKWNN